MNIIKAILSFLSNKEVYGLIIIVLGSFIVFWISKKLVNQLISKAKNEKERKKRVTIVKLLENISAYVIGIIAILFTLELYGVNTRSIIASLGVAGVILGLGLQDTVKDFFSGLSIVFDNYFSIGDIVTYNGFTGEVISLGLKTTKIKNAAGEVYSIANRKIEEIVNLSQKTSNLIIDIPTAYEENTAKVEKTIEKIISLAKKIEGVEDDSTYLGIGALDNSSVNYQIKIHCRQDLKWQVKRDVLKIIKLEYEKNNIKIPYPQLEVHNGKSI